MPRISVIIPTYNSARFLPEAIESVLAQTYKDYEIIVIDDGSTDNTKEILEPYFDKIKYIYQQNKGVSSARNTGIKHSQGEYIAFLDADDIWFPEKLHTQVDYLENNPEIAMVYSRTLMVSVDGRLLANKKSSNWNLPSGDIFNKLYLKNFIPTPSIVVVRKEVFDIIGLFDESLLNAEDRDICLRIAREFKVSGIDKYLCKYRINPESLSRKNKETVFNFRRQRIEKHYKASQDLGRPISSSLYKKALANLFFQKGKWYFAQRDRKKMLENLLLSLKYNPFNPSLLKIPVTLLSFILNKLLEILQCRS